MMTSGKNYQKMCLSCGRAFQSHRKHARYCSSTCRANATRARQRTQKHQRAEKGLYDLLGYAALQTVSPEAVGYIRQIADKFGPQAAQLALKACVAAIG